MKWMVASVALIALAAGSGSAQPDKGNDRKGNSGSPPAAQAERGGGNGGGAMRANPGSENAKSGAMRAGGGNGNSAAMRPDRGNSGVNSGGPAMRPGNRNGNSNANANANAARNAAADRGGPPATGQRANSANAAVRSQNAGGSSDYRGPSRYIGDDFTRPNRAGDSSPGLANGCPPGLAKKYNGCRPPGQVDKAGLLRRDSYELGWWGLPRQQSGNYRYDSGYLLRLNPGGSVASYIPLLGGALSLGNLWPSGYGSAGLAPYYRNFYGLGEQDNYRYADNVVYRLDPETAAITSIAALLTGDEFTVGQPAPRGYDIYNVPPSYRDRYYDTPDANYRYSDGQIYQIDPQTRLVQAAIEMLVS